MTTEEPDRRDEGRERGRRRDGDGRGFDRGGERRGGPRRGDGDRPGRGPRRGDDRPRRDFRRDDDRPRGPRRDRDGDRPRRDFRRDDDRPRGPRRDDARRGDDRPRGFRRDDDRPRGPRRDDARRDDDRPRRTFRRDDDRPRRDFRRDDDRPRRDFRRDDDRPRRDFRRDDDRPRRDFRRDDDRPRRDHRRDDDRSRGPRRDGDRDQRRSYGRGGRFERRDDRRGDRARGPRAGRREGERAPVRRLSIPEDVTGQELDKAVRQELQSLPKTLADDVAKNLVMVARLLDEDPELAYEHAKVALRLASRVGAVREAAGFAAYHTGRYQEALAEFRAARRMSGRPDLWPMMADCERGMGRPERALAMAGEPEVQRLDKAGQVEMRLVAAGARRDMGQADAAVVTLQSPELASTGVHPWTARLRYAYADALLEVGREEDAREWFAKAVEADHDGLTDASDRLAELDGIEFTDALDPDAEEEVSPVPDTGAGAGAAAAAPADDVDVTDEDAPADVGDLDDDGPDAATR